MLKSMLEDLIDVKKEGFTETDIEAGDRVRFVEGVERLIKDYSKDFPEQEEHWTKMANIINSHRRNYFSVLHVAGLGSAYPIGTVIIEIAPNEDIEVHSSVLVKI